VQRKANKALGIVSTFGQFALATSTNLRIICFPPKEYILFRPGGGDSVPV
jgi:hypothetical protein